MKTLLKILLPIALTAGCAETTFKGTDNSDPQMMANRGNSSIDALLDGAKFERAFFGNRDSGFLPDGFSESIYDRLDSQDGSGSRGLIQIRRGGGGAGGGANGNGAGNNVAPEKCDPIGAGCFMKEGLQVCEHKDANGELSAEEIYACSPNRPPMNPDGETVIVYKWLLLEEMTRRHVYDATKFANGVIDSLIETEDIQTTKYDYLISKEFRRLTKSRATIRRTGMLSTRFQEKWALNGKTYWWTLRTIKLTGSHEVRPENAKNDTELERLKDQTAGLISSYVAYETQDGSRPVFSRAFLHEIDFAGTYKSDSATYKVYRDMYTDTCRRSGDNMPWVNKVMMGLMGRPTPLGLPPWLEYNEADLTCTWQEE